MDEQTERLLEGVCCVLATEGFEEDEAALRDWIASLHQRIEALEAALKARNPFSVPTEDGMIIRGYDEKSLDGA